MEENEMIEQIQNALLNGSLRYAKPNSRYTKENIIKALEDSNFVDKLMETYDARRLYDYLPREFFEKHNEYYLKFMETDPSLIWDFPKEIVEDNPEISLKAFEKEMWTGIHKFSPEFQRNHAEEIFDLIAKKDPKMFEYINLDVRKDNSDLCMKYFEMNPAILSGIPAEIQEANKEQIIEKCSRRFNFDS